MFSRFVNHGPHFFFIKNLPCKIPKIFITPRQDNFKSTYLVYLLTKGGKGINAKNTQFMHHVLFFPHRRRPRRAAK